MTPPGSTGVATAVTGASPQPAAAAVTAVRSQAVTAAAPAAVRLPTQPVALSRVSSAPVATPTPVPAPRYNTACHLLIIYKQLSIRPPFLPVYQLSTNSTLHIANELLNSIISSFIISKESIFLVIEYDPYNINPILI